LPFIGACAVTVGAAQAFAFAMPQSQPTTQPATASRPAIPPEPSIEDEVLDNIRSRAIGEHRFADYEYPEEFLRRYADRIVRSSYEKRFRVVVHDDPEGSHDETGATEPPTTQSAIFQTSTAPALFRVVKSPVAADVQKWRASL